MGGNKTYLIVSLPIPSSISISMIFWRWSPCSWMTAGGEGERVSGRRVVGAEEEGGRTLAVLFVLFDRAVAGEFLCRVGPGAGVDQRLRDGQVNQSRGRGALLKAFRSFFGSYSVGTPERVVMVLRPLRCWIRMWM